MTRLTQHHVESIPDTLKAFDSDLRIRTGVSLKALACRAAGFQEKYLPETAAENVIAVIPISSGLGVIAGFCDAVAAVAAHVGCQTFITRKTDVAGIAEAIEKKARVLMLADDHFFVAIHHAGQHIMDNTTATAKGFAAGLELMAGGSLAGKDVLVIGCGRVGSHAVKALITMESFITIYDINPDSYISLYQAIDKKYHDRIRVAENLNHALANHRLILDASPAGNIIHAGHITPDTCISAPGVPAGLDSKAMKKIGTRLLHDPLHIGVATMAAGAMKSCRALMKSTTE
jgi:pyrrolysine biosynthesis protein PylD